MTAIQAAVGLTRGGRRRAGGGVAPRLGALPAIWIAWTTYGLLRSGIEYATAPATWQSWAMILPLQLGPAWYWALVTPLIVALERTAARRRWRIGTALLVHLLAVCVVALGWTVVFRQIVITLGGWKLPTFAATYLYWLEINLVIYVVVAGVARAVRLHADYQARERRTLALETELSHARLAFLQRQLRPHFLFNALNAIAELTHESPAAAERTVGRLSALLRAATDTADGPEVSLGEELATLEHYVDIQQLRFGDRLTVEQRVAPDALAALVPPLMLQPLVENAIMHGLANRRAPGRVRIYVKVRGGRTILAVANDGGRRPHRATPHGSGIGLRNLRDRLAQLYGSDYRFTLNVAADGGATVTIEIPFRAVRQRTVAAAPPPTATALRDDTPGGAATGDTGDTGDTQGADGGAARWSPPAWLVATGVALGAAAMITELNYAFQRVRAPADPMSFGFLARVNFTAALVWLLLAPLMLHLARRFRLRRGAWRPALLAHVVLAVGIGVAHQAIVVWSERIGPAPMVDRINMVQVTWNALLYLAVVAWSHGRDFAGWYREHGLTEARLHAAIAQARWRTGLLDIPAAFLFGTLETIGRLVREDRQRAEQLVGRFAAVLRLTLDGAARGDVPLSSELALVAAHVDTHRLASGAPVRLTVAVPSSLDEVRVPSRLLADRVEELLESAVGGAAPELDVRVAAAAVPGGTEIRLCANVSPAAGGSTVPTAPDGRTHVFVIPGDDAIPRADAIQRDDVARDDGAAHAGVAHGH